MIAPNNRTLIIGNCGSGKSTLAAKIGAFTNSPIIDLDTHHWHDAHTGIKRDEAEARRVTREIAQTPDWVMEGVFGWLAEIAVDRANTLIWLNLSWLECHEGLLTRQAQKQSPEQAFTDLVDWAQGYGSRQTSSSQQGHARLFDNFDGNAIELCSRQAANRFAEKMTTN